MAAAAASGSARTGPSNLIRQELDEAAAAWDHDRRRDISAVPGKPPGGRPRLGQQPRSRPHPDSAGLPGRFPPAATPRHSATPERRRRPGRAGNGRLHRISLRFPAARDRRSANATRPSTTRPSPKPSNSAAATPLARGPAQPDRLPHAPNTRPHLTPAQHGKQSTVHLLDRPQRTRLLGGVQPGWPHPGQRQRRQHGPAVGCGRSRAPPAARPAAAPATSAV